MPSHTNKPNNPSFTESKAKKVLSEKKPTLKGKPITGKQRGLLGVIAGGKTPTRLKQLSAIKRKS